MENPFPGSVLPRLIPGFWFMFRDQASLPSGDELHQRPMLPIPVKLLKSPLLRLPPGRAAKPKSSVPLPADQPEVDFKAVPPVPSNPWDVM